MASKLFHAVVGFGIALGAASVGCAAAPAEESNDTAAQETSNTQPDPATKATDDKFCEVGWPTTKGGPRPQRAQACIDPDRACGNYPGSLFNWATCRYVDQAGKCDTKRDELWQFCKATDQSHAWTCPTGTILQSDCPVDPAPPSQDPQPDTSW